MALSCGIVDHTAVIIVPQVWKVLALPLIMLLEETDELEVTVMSGIVTNHRSCVSIDNESRGIHLALVDEDSSRQKAARCYLKNYVYYVHISHFGILGIFRVIFRFIITPINTFLIIHVKDVLWLGATTLAECLLGGILRIQIF
jgi:hypothetical protein